MKITDGKNTIELEVRRWNGTNYGQDYSDDICQDMERDEDNVAHVDDIEISINNVLELCQNDIAENGCHIFVDDADISDGGYWIMND